VLGDILVQQRGQVGVDKMVVVEGVVLKEHDIRCEEGIL